MGTLFAFSLICLGVLYLRIKEPQLQRRFRTPVVWLTAPAGAIGCFYLISRLPQDTWWRLAIWMLLGLAVYFGYAYWHSRLHEKRQAAAGQ